MFILEKFDGDFDHDYDYDENKIYYSNVTYKDGFLETIQKALEEQNKKLNLFGKEKTPTEVIELVKKVQSTQNPSISVLSNLSKHKNMVTSVSFPTSN